MRSGAWLGLVGMLVVGSAGAEEGRPSVAAPKLTFGTSVPLGCKNPGSHQDVGKTPTILNTTGATLRAGQTLHWTATDGDKGTIKLQTDVAPNGTVQVIGAAGQSYQCTAHFLTSPDLVAKDARWASSEEATVTIGNADAWLDAPASVALLETVSCGGQVLATREIPLSVQKKSTTSAFKIPMKREPKAYLRLTVDAKKQILEKDETNNVFSDSDGCVK